MKKSSHQNEKRRKPNVHELARVHGEERAVKFKPEPKVPITPGDIYARLGLGAALLAAGVWAYWPNIREMVRAWEREPDYSHGFLVVPMTLIFLWLRRETFPGFGDGGWLIGSFLLAIAFGVRLFAGAYFFEAVDGWSLVFWVAGCVAILFGSATFHWSWPPIGFLIFMVPLPFRMESLMSMPLQRIATNVSCWTLQVLGQPAIAEGNTILLGEHHLEVEQACSGLRLFMSILALAFAYLILIRRPWWEKSLLLVSVVPIAIVANSARIVATGILYEFVSSDAARRFSHDFAGWAMVPFAAVLFGLVLWYLGKVFPEREEMDLGSMMRRG